VTSKHLQAILDIDIDAILDATPVGQVESTLERLLSQQDAAIATHAANFATRLRDRGDD
jgi:hypothetical protein